MRTFFVIELHSLYDSGSYLINPVKRQPLKQFVFDRVVDPFGYGIVFRISAFGHTDTYLMVFQNRSIGIGSILYPTVGMMDQFAKVFSRVMGQSHFQGLQGITDLQGFTYAVTDNFLGIIVCNQG